MAVGNMSPPATPLPQNLIAVAAQVLAYNGRCLESLPGPPVRICLAAESILGGSQHHIADVLHGRCKSARLDMQTVKSLDDLAIVDLAYESEGSGHLTISIN